MPRKLRQQKARRDRLTLAETLHLISGHDFFGAAFDCDEDLRGAWENHRLEILEYAAQDPLRSRWPIYSELRFDRGMSREKALAERRKAHER